ncbi:2OG-Fe(II) oxygenase family protein [Thermosynechococcaceae cyanobacterium BACA0444]|uniref:2OG-Fe(II) oxygenase family protein n=1 Tax=Pseudocalidococcus azoricus BACA0444 TaxID=2918990 RepID=A0AAE4FV34_9CYAN|nr:2OG-Fe(II) oxygenase family protein [Pseudocalidococcus azoricus]MDS3861827.1 2OG-Fe(II) oxygenase family protein [Pseudocalidococcus azoricus BACA0444]
MSGFLRIDYQAPTAAVEFTASLHNIGFAVLQSPPIPAGLVEQVYADWQSFFSSDEKFNYTFDPQRQRGYFPFQMERAKNQAHPDLKEFFHLYAREDLPPGLGAATWVLFQALIRIGADLLTWLEAYCPPEIQARFQPSLVKMTQDSPETLLRILHYPPLPKTVPRGVVRAAAHEDVNLITLLPAATQAGLEVQDRHGAWYRVPAEAGDLVVNVGDMLQLASQSYYCSTTHQVVNPEDTLAGESRFSLPLFIHPHPDVQLTPEITAQAYLQQRLQEIGLL